MFVKFINWINYVSINAVFVVISRKSILQIHIASWPCFIFAFPLFKSTQCLVVTPPHNKQNKLNNHLMVRNVVCFFFICFFFLQQLLMNFARGLRSTLESL